MPRRLAQGDRGGIHQNSRYIRDFHRSRHEAPHHCDARMDTNPRTVCEEQSDDEIVKVDLSSYSGAAIDYVQGVATENFDSYQAFHDCRLQLQTDAFNLFHRASCQLKEHCVDRACEVDGLQRSNAFRRPQVVRNALYTLHPESPDEFDDTSQHVLVREPALSRVHENTESDTIARGTPPFGFDKDEATIFDTTTLSEKRKRFISTSDGTWANSRVFDPTLEEADDKDAPASSTSSLCAESLSSVRTIFGGSARVGHMDNYPSEVCNDATGDGNKSALAIKHDQRQDPELFTTRPVFVEIPGKIAPQTEAFERECIRKYPAGSYKTRISTKIPRASTRVSRTDLNVGRDPLSTANVISDTPERADGLSACEDVTSPLLTSQIPISSPDYNLSGFVSRKAQARQLPLTERTILSPRPLLPVPHVTESIYESSYQAACKPPVAINPPASFSSRRG